MAQTDLIPGYVVCAVRSVIKLRRVAVSILAKTTSFTFTNIQGVLLLTDFIALTIDGNRTGTANIDTYLTRDVQEMAYAELFTNFPANGNRFSYRHNAANNNTVNVAVNHGVLIGDKYLSTKNSLRSPWRYPAFLRARCGCSVLRPHQPPDNQWKRENRKQ